MASSRLERIGTIYSRKQCSDNLFKSLSEITTQVEADYNAMKENEQKLEHLTGTYMKCIQQATIAYKHKLKVLKEIHTSFKKEYEDMESEHKVETQKLVDELEYDIKKLQDKLVTESKRSSWESLRRSIFHAMQNDIVEGLLIRGAMKPDDRPLWFDVYKAFPPLVEPKFARPKPELKPIRPIFYQEDIIRAKFHDKGHGLGPVNMLAQSNDTQTKRLVQQYEKLKAEGIPEEELVEKSAIAVGMERKEQFESAKSAKTTPKNPESVTAQVLSEADLKNIFKE